jgi:uncharacterized protein (UPF0333 family)
MQENEDRKEPKFLETFLGKVVVVAVVIVGVYFLMSPYQNCLRGGLTEYHCTMNTSW